MVKPSVLFRSVVSLIVTKTSPVVAHGEKMFPIDFKSFRQGQTIIFFISIVICSVYNAVVFDIANFGTAAASKNRI